MTERVPLMLNRLRILQINLNKSEKAHLDLLNGQLGNEWDVVLIQEPHVTPKLDIIRTPSKFTQICPADRWSIRTKVRSAIWVNKAIDTSTWKEVKIPNTNDLTAVQLYGEHGRITIFNIYNSCTHSRTEAKLRKFVLDNKDEFLGNENDHLIWAGDFNRHHPMWDEETNEHLFTPQALEMADQLIDILGELGLEMALPRDIPTLQHMRSKNYSRPDNVFCTARTMDLVIRCEVDTRLQPPKTDHFPIVTILDIPQKRLPPPERYNFKKADWVKFRRCLEDKVVALPEPTEITDEIHLERAAAELTEALQGAMQDTIEKTREPPDAKRWWNGELRKMKREQNKLSSESMRFRALPNHPSHQQLKEARNQYAEEIVKAKRQHWEDFLEEAGPEELWVANRYLKQPAGDGGRPRIPTLKTTGPNGEQELNTNEEKAKIFATTFFPPPPANVNIPDNYEYPEPLPDPNPITKRQVQNQLKRLSPYKAAGPDEIPNIVLQQSFELIADHLLRIYQAVFKLQAYPTKWKEFTTVVL